MEGNKIPKEVPMVLKKVGEGESFKLIAEKPILPHGLFVLVPKVEVGSAGEIKEKLILKPEQVSTNANTYQELSSWSVARKKAYLDEITFYSNNPAKGIFELIINKDTIFTGKKIQNILDAPIPHIKLNLGDKITLNCKSDGATTVLFDGCIQGREVGE